MTLPENPRRFNIARGAIFFIPCLLLITAGCGDGKGRRIPVSGVVTIDGHSLSHGSVTFMPVSKGDGFRAGGGSLNENGEFQISSFTLSDGLLVGKYDVTVLGTEHISESAQRWHAPKKYSELKNSGLTAEIASDVEKLTFELTWKGSKNSKPFVEKY